MLYASGVICCERISRGLINEGLAIAMDNEDETGVRRGAAESMVVRRFRARLVLAKRA